MKVYYYLVYYYSVYYLVGMNGTYCMQTYVRPSHLLTRAKLAGAYPPINFSAPGIGKIGAENVSKDTGAAPSSRGGIRRAMTKCTP